MDKVIFDDHNADSPQKLKTMCNQRWVFCNDDIKKIEVGSKWNTSHTKYDFEFKII